MNENSFGINWGIGAVWCDKGALILYMVMMVLCYKCCNVNGRRFSIYLRSASTSPWIRFSCL